MTDLELTVLCANAMGRPAVRGYDPLNDDAQAFVMVKKFDIVIEREKDKSFGITLFTNEHKGGHPTFVVRNQPDLNRALVECVAKMQQSKQHPLKPRQEGK